MKITFKFYFSCDEREYEIVKLSYNAESKIFFILTKSNESISIKRKHLVSFEITD